MESDMINTHQDGGRGGIQRMQHPYRRTTGPTRRSTKGQWTAEEDEILRRAVERFRGKNWKKIADCIKDRTDVQCLHRWQKVLNPDLVKGPWSKEEDELINELVKKYGAKKWSTIASHMPGRIGKQCRERWHNHLNPNINKDVWTQEEELILIQAHQIYGNKWAELMKFLPGRSDNAIKNHWNSAVKKKLDTYVTSSLPAQFQGPPQVNDIIESMPSSSSTAQWGLRNESVHQDGAREAEEVSECSQEITGNFNTNSEEVVPLPLQELPSELDGLSNFPGHSYPRDVDNFVNQDWNSNPNQLHNISSPDLGNNFFSHSVGVDESHGLMPFPQLSMEKPGNVIAEGDCFGIILADLDMAGDLFSRNFRNCSSVALLNQPLHYEISHYNGESGFINNSSQFNDVSRRSQEDEFANKSPSNDIYHQNDNVESILECGDCNISSQDEHVQAKDSLQLAYVESFSSDLAKDSPELVPVDVSSSISSLTNNEATSTKNKSFTVVSAEENDKRLLCYEPLHFPSVDIPFFSCDLLQAGNDGHQEFSPLGIRRLMMSSANCLSPLRLWDSPTRVKTFTCTPSILKKRNRDLISPISEKRDEKRPEMEMDQELYCDLMRDFSRLDVMFFENESYAPDKENWNLEPETEDVKDEKTNKSVKEDDIDKNNFQDQGSQPLGILVEHNMNDMFFLSPDPFGVKSDNINLGKQCSKRLGCTSSVSVFISPVVSKKEKGQLRHPEALSESCANDSGLENIKFGDTPLKRSFESPSAWKSPWFFNSFIPGSRVDTDISIEDIGYYLSPGDRGVDAIELMKHLSEQNEDAFAGAKKVLVNETPKTILKGIRMNSSPRNHTAIASKILTEKRVLDFSDCGSPGKEKNSKASTCMNLSNPY